MTALSAFVAAAQDAALQDLQKKVKAELQTLKLTTVGMGGGVMSNVKNAPYRADQITEFTQTLGDGTRIHNEDRVTIYRDTQGRVRRETPEEISIWDPNAGLRYVLDPQKLTARTMQVSVSMKPGSSGGLYYFQQTGQAPMPPAGSGLGDKIRVASQTTTEDITITLTGKTETMASNKESLGTQVMEGVSAQGERQTRTIETGDIGNDRPIQIINERWYSPDLQVDVMTRRSDPRSGEEIMRLTNINRAEPDASLFQVPAGYQIVEGKTTPMLKVRQ